MSSKMLKRTASVIAQGTAVTPNCIKGFIDYVISKGRGKNVQAWKDTNPGTVVENLIQVMISKGYTNLSIAGINALKDEINKPKFSRATLYNFISEFAGRKHTTEVSDARDELTISGSALTDATMEADPGYQARTYQKSTNPAIVMTDSERELAQRIKYGKSDETSIITRGTKKQCSTCWICGSPVYVYELTVQTGSSSKNTYISCGQDEHVSPPGVGNLFGLLYPDKQTQINQILIENGFAKYGLKSAHDWCNQIKSDYNLISPPRLDVPDQGNYSINEVSLNTMIEKARTWLAQGATNRIDIDPLFHKPDDTASNERLIASMRDTMSRLLNDLCTTMNANTDINYGSLQGNITPYTAYTLRLIFFSCFIGYNVVFKDNKAFIKMWTSMSGKPKKGRMVGGATEEEEKEAFRIIVGEIIPPSLCNMETLNSIDTEMTTDNEICNELEDSTGDELYERVIELFNIAEQRSMLMTEKKQKESQLNMYTIFRSSAVRQQKITKLRSAIETLDREINSLPPLFPESSGSGCTISGGKKSNPIKRVASKMSKNKKSRGNQKKRTRKSKKTKSNTKKLRRK
jgi:hypothetical protein